jgi:hypothetical protein
MCCPRFCARLRPSAVRVRIRSLSTSASPPGTAIISRPVLVPVSAHGSASERNLRLGVHNLLHDGEKVESAAREAVDARHRHDVAGREGAQHLEELAAVAVRARPFLAENLGASRLLKLGVERLPVGADAGIAETAVLRVSFSNILLEA